MNKIIKKTKNKIFFISPEEINLCIFPTKYCDHTQFKLDKSRVTLELRRFFPVVVLILPSPVPEIKLAFPRSPGAPSAASPSPGRSSGR